MSTDAELIQNELAELLKKPKVKQAVARLKSLEDNAEAEVDRVERATVEANEELIQQLDKILAKKAAEDASLKVEEGEPQKKKLRVFRSVANKIKSTRESIAKDSRELFKKHVLSVFKETRAELKENKLRKLGTILSFAGKTWDGINDFIEELALRHRSIDAIHTIGRSFAVSAYAASVPILGVIKALDFLGRVATEYGKGAKFLQSVVKAGKETGASIAKHFLKATAAKYMTPAVKAFYEKVGLNDEQREILAEIVEDKNKASKIGKLSIEQAKKAAGQMAQLAAKSTGLGAGFLADVVVAATSNDLGDKETQSLVGSLVKNKARLKNMAPSMKSMAIEKVTKHLKGKPGVAAGVAVVKTIDAIAKKRVQAKELAESVREFDPKTYKKHQALFKRCEGQDMTLEDFQKIVSSEDKSKKLGNITEKLISKAIDESLEFGGQLPTKQTPKSKSSIERAKKRGGLFHIKLKKRPKVNFKHLVSKKSSKTVPAQPSK